jgi:dTDP-4-amino-4,6-dideoxygalactose transaminase
VTPIPLVNLRRQYAELREPIRHAIDKVLENQAFIQGAPVAAFAEAFRLALGANHAIGCSNGTTAIEIVLRAYGIGAGDEVITVSHTFFATTEAILNVGGVPVLVDVDPQTHTMDPTATAAAVTARTRAIVPVHLYGMPCDLDGLRAVASRHMLLLLEDAAQAHLARYKGRIVGGDSEVATFSFYPGKNLGAYGDAGAIVCRDATMADKLARLVDHGRSGKYTHDLVGSNARMDALQGAVLAAKLPHLKAWNNRRRAVVARYGAALASAGFLAQAPPQGAESAHHLFVVQVENRDETLAALNAAGIGAGIHYPVPIHLQKVMEPIMSKPLSLPVTERLAQNIISLPLCGSITDDEVDRVIESFLRVARPCGGA